MNRSRVGARRKTDKMVKIPLTRGKYAVVDDNMAHLSNYKWCFMGSENYGYAKRRNGRKLMFLHHAVVGYPLNGCQVDHVDGNRLNNRRANLRIVTRRENMQNMACHRNGKKSSKYVGVCFDKARGRWVASITLNMRHRHLGRFDSEREASNAYQIACRDVERNVPGGTYESC